MSVLTITRGLPGAGKTTWARQHAAKTGAVRINRDDMRAMLYGAKTGLSWEQEKAITDAVQALAVQHLRAGRDVVADDMNLRPVYVREWRKLSAANGAEFQVHEIPLSVAEAIARQDQRPEADRVPAEAITHMAVKYLRRGEFLPVADETEAETPGLYVPNVDLPPVILCDIDGTVALMGDRNPYDLTTVSQDEPNRPVAAVVGAIARDRHLGIVFMSGRDESCRVDTEAWLRKHLPSVREIRLHMRPAGDMRRDAIVKRELFDSHIRGRFNAVAVLDDRSQVVQMWRALGLVCMQVAEGDF